MAVAAGLTVNAQGFVGATTNPVTAPFRMVRDTDDFHEVVGAYSGLSKPSITRAVGVAVLVAVGDGLGVADATGLGVLLGFGLAVGLGVADTTGLGVLLGLGLAVGLGVTEATGLGNAEGAAVAVTLGDGAGSTVPSAI